MFDLTRPQTFDAVSKWKADIDAKVTLTDDKPIPCVLLANKCDLPAAEGFQKSAGEMDKFVRDNNFVQWFVFCFVRAQTATLLTLLQRFETSAKDNINIEKAAKFLITRILELDVNRQSATPDVVKLNNTGSSEEKKGCCK